MEFILKNFLSFFILLILTSFTEANTTQGRLTGIATNITAKHIGSGVGGAMFATAIHPTDKKNIFFSGDMGVVYHTTNGGTSWKIVPGMDHIRFMQFDPKNPNIVWAGGGSGLFKSIDGGKNWKFSFYKGPYNYALGAMAIDPTDSNIIYAAEGFVPYINISWVRGKVFKSTDGGTTWKKLTRPGGKVSEDDIYNRNYSSIVIDPNSPYVLGEGHSDVYLVGRDGFFKTKSAGDSWNKIMLFDGGEGNSKGQGSNMVLVDNNGKSILFASVIPISGHTKGGVYRSDDNGITWVEKNEGIGSIISKLKARNGDIRNSRQFSFIITHSSVDNRLYLGSWQGVLRSDDLGETWTIITEGETPYAQHKDGTWLAVPKLTRPNHAQTFLGGIDNFIGIEASKSDSDFVIFSDNQDLHISNDGGLTWQSGIFDYTDRFINTNIVIPSLNNNSPKNRYTHKIKSRGVQSTVNTDIAIDPFDSNIYYASYMDIGLQISRDAGDTWEHPSNGILPKGHSWSILVDPAVEGHLWVSIQEAGAIYFSTDKGFTWTKRGIDVSAGKVTDMILDINSNKNSRLLYATTEKKGVYKSTDGGSHWINILSEGAFDIKMDPSNSNILYVGTINGLYKSSDSGVNWNKLESSNIGKVLNLSIGLNQTIYLTAHKPGEQYSWQFTKLWKSEDGGVSFTELTPSFMNFVRGVAVNPIDSNYLYISNFKTLQTKASSKLIMARSKDGGETWEQIGEKFAFTMGRDIYINPKNSQQVFFNSNFSLIEVLDKDAARKPNIPVNTLIANAGVDRTHHDTASNRAIHLESIATASLSDIVKYEWYKGDTFIGAGQSRWYVLTENGTHEFTLVVTDVHGNTARDSFLVEVESGTTSALNHAPTATNVTISGVAKTGETLTLNYIFQDVDGDREGNSIIAWSTPTLELQRGTSKTFSIPPGYEGEEIGAWVRVIDEHGLAMESLLDIPASNNTITIQSEQTNQAPTLTLTGANPLRLDTTQLFIEPGATAIDHEDGDITNQIEIVSTVQNQTAGIYEVSYTIEDSNGKKAMAVREVIYTVKENELPLIEILGGNPLLLNIDEAFVEPGIAGRDREDGDITDQIKTVANTINSSVAGSYEVKYELTDSGNSTVYATRRIVVVSDSKPVILLVGESTVNLNLGVTYVEKGASVVDLEDGDITSKLTIDVSSLDISKAGEYEIVYTVTDSDNNTQSIVRKVIVENNTKGTLTGVASNIVAKHIGAGVGGAMFAIAIHPTDKNNIFFSGDMGVVYHTTNGGENWKIIPGMEHIRFLKFDITNPTTIWAGGGNGLYKSIDGGISWKHTFHVGSYAASLGSIAIDPTNSNIVYVAEGFTANLKISWVRGKVWKSIDAGLTWKELTRPGGEIGVDSNYNRNYSTIIIDPNSTYISEKGHNQVYLVGRDGIFKSVNGGDSWSEITFFDSGQGADMVLVDNNGHSVLFASVIPMIGHSKKGIYRSDDNGNSWNVKNIGLSSIVNRLEIRNKNIKNIAQFPLMLAHSPIDNKLYVGSWQGIATSDNLGESWNQNTVAETPFVQHASGTYLAIPSNNRVNHSESFLGGIDNLIKIKVSNTDSNFVMFGDNQDLHISRDGGITWKSGTFDYTNSFEDLANVIPSLVGTNPPSNRYTHKIKSRGIQGTVNTDIAVDPFNPQIYYATYMDVGLQITRDAGVTWEHPSNGIPARGHAWSVEVDPEEDGHLWVSAKEEGNIYFSTDNGKTWEDISIGDSSVGKVTDIVLDNNSDKNNRLLYVSTEKKGVYKSINGGQSWINIFSTGAFDIKLDPVNSNILYVGTIDGLFKSINKGVSWTKLAGTQMGKVYNISVGKNNRVYVTSNRTGKSAYWSPRQLWKSEDGVNFSEITPVFMSYIGAVAVNPKNPNYLYISNFNKIQTNKNDKMIMARSNDGGRTWEQIAQNFAFTMGRDIFINPKDSQHIFFNTNFSLIEIFDNEAPN